MKKIILLFPIAGFMYACSGRTDHSTETSKVSQEQIENIEHANMKMDQLIDSTEVEIEILQTEIDELLNEI